MGSLSLLTKNFQEMFILGVSANYPCPTHRVQRRIRDPQAAGRGGGARGMEGRECPKMYRKSVLHLL